MMTHLVITYYWSNPKIGDGRYTAINQVTLLPGFEATAKDAFLAKIGSTNTYPTFNTIVLIDMDGSGKESRGSTGKRRGVGVRFSIPLSVGCFFKTR